MNSVLAINNLNSELRISSREVAEMMQSRHDVLIKKITALEVTLRDHHFVVSEFWVASTYKVEGNNKSYKEYLISKKGCELLAHKSTGEKGILFTVKYMEKFNAMENALKNQSKGLMTIEDILIRQLTEQKNIKTRVENLENKMTIDYEQQEELNSLARRVVVEKLGGKHTPAYKLVGKKAFKRIWVDYQRLMGVNSYKNTPVKSYQKGKDILGSWEPDADLKLMILGANSQQLLNI